MTSEAYDQVEDVSDAEREVAFANIQRKPQDIRA